MPLKFRLEVDVVLDADAQARVIEAARQLCLADARHPALDQQRLAELPPAEEIIDRPEDALMELLERNPLLAEARVQIERISNAYRADPARHRPARSRSQRRIRRT